MNRFGALFLAFGSTLAASLLQFFVAQISVAADKLYWSRYVDGVYEKALTEKDDRAKHCR